MATLFPRTTVAGVSMPRMIMGTNWIYGYSHRTPSADRMIQETNGNAQAVASTAEVFLNAGVDATMGPICTSPRFFYDGIHAAEDRTGRKMTLIDTPVLNMDDNAAARKEAEGIIRDAAKGGATFLLIHHAAAEQLVNKNLRSMPRLPDYLSMIRDAGMIPGLSAHMPELIVYSDENEYDVQTYIQIYNCMGYLMQVEIEYIHKVIWNAKKPVMTIKPMAAGRVTPFVGLSFAWATLRPCDMVTVGCFNPEEAAEDIEISLAALERRAPDIAGRASPKKTEIMKG